MKWLKRLLLVAVFVVVFVLALGIGAWWLARGTPKWYARPRPSRQQLAAAAERAERQMQLTLNWASDPAHHNASSSRPVQPYEVSFTEDELNGFFQKWDVAFGWSGHYGQYLSDPQIVLGDGSLILAAVLKDSGTLVSIEFDPQLRDGKLLMPVERVLAGRLPVPRSFWDGYRQKLEQSIQQRLPAWRLGAKIASDGAANSDAVAAGMSELLLDALNGRPARPVLFLPYDFRDGAKSLPVRLTQVQIADKTLTLTVEPISTSQRRVLLEEIRSGGRIQTAWQNADSTC